MSENDEKMNTSEDLANEMTDQTDANGEASSQDTLTIKAEECKALNDKYMRLAAEFENYKRLSQRDQRDQVRYGNEQNGCPGPRSGADAQTTGRDVDEVRGADHRFSRTSFRPDCTSGRVASRFRHRPSSACR